MRRSEVAGRRSQQKHTSGGLRVQAGSCDETGAVYFSSSRVVSSCDSYSALSRLAIFNERFEWPCGGFFGL